MSAISYIASDYLLFLKFTARSVHIGDIVKTRWGLREVLDMSLEEGDAWFKFRDNKLVVGEYAMMEVLVP